MKKLFLLILIIVSLNSFGQGKAASTLNVMPDTAAQRKEQEAANKFVSELVSKTSIKDFQHELYEMNVGVKDMEAFIRLYNFYINQKYIQSKSSKK